MARILVTGGCGYIGSHTIVDLLDHGHEVVSVDNYVNSDDSALAGIHKITGTQVTNLEVDLKELDRLEAVFARESFDAIIHFAALKSVGESVEVPLDYFDNNVSGLLNLLRCQIKYQVPHFIFSSSCSVYGNADTLPVTEDTPLQEAESPYARTKRMCEEIMADVSSAHPKLRFVLLRYFNPAGAHPSIEIGEAPRNVASNLVPVITETAIGKRTKMTVFGDDYPTRDGSCIRDYIHVMDLAHAHTLSLQLLLDRREEKAVQVLNVGTGNGVTVLEAIEAFRRVADRDLNYVVGPRRPGDVIAIYADYSKAKSLIGWQPTYSIDQIMDTAWQWELKRTSAASYT